MRHLPSWTGHIWADSNDGNENHDEPKYIFNGNWRYASGARWMVGYISVVDGDDTGEPKRFIARLMSSD